GLRDIERFPLRHTWDDIDEHHVVDIPLSQSLRGRASDVASSDDGDFRSRHHPTSAQKYSHARANHLGDLGTLPLRALRAQGAPRHCQCPPSCSVHPATLKLIVQTKFSPS